MSEVPYGFCECGCGRRTKLASCNNRSKGWVKGEPMRFLRSCTHNRKKTRFLLDPETGCWEWQLAKLKGYGQVGVKENGRHVIRYAHRVYYVEAKGPIPEGLELDHLCRNPGCVNPDHLEPVTHRENMFRGVGVAAQNARKTHCPQGHPYDKDNTIINGKGGWRQCRTCHSAAGKRYYKAKRALNETRGRVDRV